jgi:hypothetical protein
VAEDLGGHLRPRRQRRVAVPAQEEHIRVKGLALLRRESVHQQALARANAVLLATE